MAAVVLPHTFTDASAADGSNLQQNFDALVAGVNNVATEQIGAAQVTADKMAANSVATLAIQNGAVTGPKLATGAVDATKLAASLQAISHQQVQASIANGGASANFDFSGYDTTLYPVVQVYWTEGANTRVLGSEYVGGTGVIGPFRVVIAFVGATFRVTVFNDSTVNPSTVTVCVVGKRA